MVLAPIVDIKQNEVLLYTYHEYPELRTSKRPGKVTTSSNGWKIITNEYTIEIRNGRFSWVFPIESVGVHTLVDYRGNENTVEMLTNQFVQNKTIKYVAVVIAVSFILYWSIMLGFYFGPFVLPPRNVIKTGFTMDSNQQYSIDSEKWKLKLYSNCTLTVKKGFDERELISPTHTKHSTFCYLVFQDTGELVMRSNEGKIIWTSGTWGGGFTQLTVDIENKKIRFFYSDHDKAEEDEEESSSSFIPFRKKRFYKIL